jgi:hypothetical protein
MVKLFFASLFCYLFDIVLCRISKITIQNAIELLSAGAGNSFLLLPLIVGL